ncbi:hypothetical protein HG452_001470 [Candidatus Saccharibacteria bacterium]|nr:hypothetical protein [Candidatus Saccharibacteria bacterium]
MNTTNKKIKELLGKIRSLIGDDKKSMEWFHEVQAKASTFETKEEEIAYLEDMLTKLQDSNNEDTEDTDEEELKNVRSNPWPIISLFFGIVIAFAIAFGFYRFLCPRANAANSSTNTVSSSTISKSVDLPKEDFKIMDYVVSSGNEIKPNPDMKNEQHKVFANGSSNNSLSDEKDVAIKEMTDYMTHNVSALKEKAMAFGIVSQNTDEKKWLENRNGSLYYNKEGQEIFYQVKAFLNRSKITSKVMEDGSNYYTTGLNKDNKVVISRSSQDLSGQRYLEVKNPEGSTEKYSYRVLIICGNTVMKNNNIPGIPTENIEIPKPKKPNEPDKPGKPSEPDKPGKPSEPDKPGKPSEPKNEQAKKPELDPANQGKAPVGGGQNDGSENGSETPKASLPEKYVAPKAPSSQSSSSSATTPSQDSRISEPSQWSGAGSVTDSNGTTKVTDNGAVTTPDGRNYSGLTNPSSVPPVESGVNGTTVPSSSANFAGNGSMSEPAIED